MSVCTHPRTGMVTSRPPEQSPFDVDSGHATAPVCDLPTCIDEATKWVQRMSHKPAFHVLDEVPR